MSRTAFHPSRNAPSQCPLNTQGSGNGSTSACSRRISAVDQRERIHGVGGRLPLKRAGLRRGDQVVIVRIRVGDCSCCRGVMVVDPALVQRLEERDQRARLGPPVCGSISCSPPRNWPAAIVVLHVRHHHRDER